MFVDSDSGLNFNADIVMDVKVMAVNSDEETKPPMSGDIGIPLEHSLSSSTTTTTFSFNFDARIIVLFSPALD